MHISKDGRYEITVWSNRLNWMFQALCLAIKIDEVDKEMYLERVVACGS